MKPTPLSPREREKFMELMNECLRGFNGEIGAGVLSRIGRDCQRAVRWGRGDEAPLLRSIAEAPGYSRVDNLRIKPCLEFRIGH